MLSKKLVNGDGFHCFLLCAPISPYKLNQLNMTVVDNCLNEYSSKSADGKIQILKKEARKGVGVGCVWFKGEMTTTTGSRFTGHCEL